MNMRRYVLIAFVLLVAALPLLPVPEFWITQANYIGLYSLVALGLVLLTGVAGLTSFGQAAFVGVGAYAAAYRKPTAGIRANLARMLAAFELPPDRLPREVFLTLVQQYWFDPSPDVAGRWLFTLDCPTDA